MLSEAPGSRASASASSTSPPPAKGNLGSQRDHYDKTYAGLSPEKLARQAACERFLPYAIETQTSWYGLYRGGLETRLAGKRVLELGAGDGLNALIMSRLGAEVTAFELSPVACEIMRQAAGLAGLRLESRAEDFLQAELPPFDFVVGKAFPHHLPSDIEDRFLARIAASLAPGGEARFVEPAINSEALDTLRWLIPVPGRPSLLQREKFRRWKENDPHPEQPYSTQHYREAAGRHFDEVDIEAFGGLKRVERFFREPRRREAVGRASLRFERRFVPSGLATAIARTQSIVLRAPRRAR